MALTAEAVLALSQNTKALSKEQLARIGELAPEMTEEEFENLKGVLEKTQKELENAKEVLKQVGALQKEYLIDQEREKNQSTEAVERVQDSQKADKLISF